MQFQIFQKRVAEAGEISVDWLKNVRKKQYEQYEAFNLLHESQHWDEIPGNGNTLLNKKIGYAMFDAPPLGHTTQTGYSIDQEAQIKPVAERFNQLSTHDGLIKFSCVFVITQSKSEERPYLIVPLFLIPDGDSNWSYMDPNCRLYKSWENFLTSNNLAASVMFCYPLSGRYNKTDGFQVAFSKTPVTDKILYITDVTGNVASVTSGLAGVGVLGAAVVGVATPILAPVAIVSGVVGGSYGIIRGVWKMRDKHKHKESITGKDCLNLGANLLSVVGGGALAASERVVVLATRVAQGVNFVNGVVKCFFTNEDPNLDSVLRDIYDHKEKILFYFNTSSSVDAITTIKQTLHMDSNATTVKVLEQFVQINSISCTEEIGMNIIKKEYVSENVTNLVTCLLKVFSEDLKNTVLTQDKIKKIYNSYKSEQINQSMMEPNLQRTLSELSKNLLNLDNIKKLMTDRAFVNELSKARIGENLIQALESKDNSLLLLTMRDLVWSLIYMIQMGNRFYNDITHKPIKKKGFEGEYHPLAEIVDKIRALADQGQSAVDLSSQENDELNGFIDRILSFLVRIGPSSWKAREIGKYFMIICNDITVKFEYKLNEDRQQVRRWKDPQCSNLFVLFNQLGNKGNYGSNLLQKVLNEYQPPHKIEMETNSLGGSFILPAWPSCKDLYCYWSETEVRSKIDIVEKIKKLADNYVQTQFKDFWMISPDDKDLGFPAYIVFSSIDKCGHEIGFIWCET